MKNKRRHLAAICILLAPMAAATEAEILFGDDSVLKGTIVSLTDKQLEVRHEGADRPLLVSPAAITTLFVRSASAQPIEFKDRMQLSDGSDNSIPCKVVRIDRENVTFRCPYTKQRSINRSSVVGIALNRRNLMPLWRLPILFDSSWRIQEQGENAGQVTEQIESMKPEMDNGRTLYRFSDSGANLLKQVNLDFNAFEFTTTVLFRKHKDKAKQAPSITFTFQTHFVNHTINGAYKKYKLLARFQDGEWALVLDEQLSPQKKLAALKISDPYSPMNVTVKAYPDPNDGSSTVYELQVNNRDIARASLTNQENLYDKGSFGIKVPKNTELTLEDPLLSNLLPFQATQFSSAIKHDILETNESEALPGSLVSYSDQNNTFTFEFENGGGTVPIPGRYITAVVFQQKTGKADAPDPAFDPCQVTLRDGSSWRGNDPRIRNGNLSLNNKLLGSMTIPLDQIDCIEFFKQKPPTKSTP